MIRLTDEELYEFIKINFMKVRSKNGMVNRVRGQGLSASIARIHNIYNEIKKEIK